MNISQTVIDKIKEENKKHRFNEFGGYLLVENNTVTDIIFDMERQSPGHVKLGINNILKLPEDQQSKVRGWFHKHGIHGYSQLDIHTILDLTNFWDECYTIVLQSNNKLLCTKTIKGNDILLGSPTIVETETTELEIFPYQPITNRIFSWARNSINEYNRNPITEDFVETPEPTVLEQKSSEPPKQIPPNGNYVQSKCPGCSHPINQTDSFCQHCGHKIKKQKFGKGIRI